MKNIDIAIKNKIATVTSEDVLIVCGNNDYIINFTFDEEWSEAEKTARFIFDGKVLDINFTGDSCTIPKITGSREVRIGIFADDIASSYVRIGCVYSALCEDITGIDPEPINPDNEALNAEVAKLKADNKALKESNEALQAENTALETSNTKLTASNKALQSANTELETRVDELEASIKPEQEKSVDITENGTTEVTPDNGKTLSKVTVNVDVPSSGGTEEIENFWYETSKNWTAQFNYLFRYSTNIKNLPKLNFENATGMRHFASYSTLESIDYYIDTANTTDFYQAFFSCQNLKTIVGINISNATNVYEIFKNCKKLETIQEPLDFSKVVASNQLSGVFVGCNELKNVKFAENSLKFSINMANCSLLTNNSIKSIVNGLATVETKQILTLHTSIIDKLVVDDDLFEYFDIAIEKNWSIE